MKKQLVLWSAVSVFVMIGLPFLAVMFAGDAGMMICFMLFFAVNPIYSGIVGAVAGKAIKELWILPIISSVLFIVGVWVFFTMSEVIFIVYAFVYLVIAVIAMFVSNLINKKRVLN